MSFKNPFSLLGKNILITGASSGIGMATSILCANMGANIIITARNKEKLDEIISDLPGDNRAIKADITNAQDRIMLVDQLPKLDGIVHCAGISSRVPCKNISKADIETLMDVNVHAPILLQAEILQAKKVNKAASIVFLASRAAFAPSPGNAIYSASKGAILSYAKCLALELSNRLIRVNCISPGMVWTNLILKGDIDIEQLRESELTYPLKRYGKAEDIANLAIYLLSDASSWMTGANIDISGGGEGLLTL